MMNQTLKKNNLWSSLVAFSSWKTQAAIIFLLYLREQKKKLKFSEKKKKLNWLRRIFFNLFLLIGFTHHLSSAFRIISTPNNESDANIIRIKRMFNRNVIELNCPQGGGTSSQVVYWSNFRSFTHLHQQGCLKW